MNQTLVLQGFYHFCGLNSGLGDCGKILGTVTHKYRRCESETVDKCRDADPTCLSLPCIAGAAG